MWEVQVKGDKESVNNLIDVLGIDLRRGTCCLGRPRLDSIIEAVKFLQPDLTVIVEKV